MNIKKESKLAVNRVKKKVLAAAQAYSRHRELDKIEYLGNEYVKLGRNASHDFYARVDDEGVVWKLAVSYCYDSENEYHAEYNHYSLVDWEYSYWGHY